MLQTSQYGYESLIGRVIFDRLPATSNSIYLLRNLETCLKSKFTNCIEIYKSIS